MQRTPCLALKTSSLKRYQAFYKLKPETDDRLLAQSVSQHFHNQVCLAVRLERGLVDALSVALWMYLASLHCLVADVMATMISSRKSTAHHIGLICPQDPSMSTAYHIGIIRPQGPISCTCTAHLQWPYIQQRMEKLSSIGLRVLVVLDTRWTRELPLFP